MDWGIKQVEVIQLSQRTQWYALVRLFFIIALAIPGLVSLYLHEGASDYVRAGMSLFVIAIASNLLFYALSTLSRAHTYHVYLSGALITLDILLVSALIVSNGGIESRYPILYTVPILIAAALFGRRAIYVTATASAAVYVSLIIADYTGVIISSGAYDPTLRTNLGYTINTISFFPAILFVIAFCTDFITTLLFEKQQQLVESLAALENAQDLAHLGSWEWDIQKDEIMWSKELFRIYGLKPRSKPLSYDSYLQLLQTDQVSEHNRIVKEAMRKKTSFKSDHEIIAADGTRKHLHAEGRPVYGANGNVIKMTGTSQDMTEQHKLDSIKREFVSLASHQLRTPASAVKAFISLLIDGHAGPLNDKQLEFVQQADKANSRQLQIIEKLLGLAAIESGKMTLNKQTQDLRSIVAHLLPAHHVAAKTKRQRLILQTTRQHIPVRVDVAALTMAIDNLVSNAIAYTPEKGKVVISYRKTNTSAYIDITDTGVGIAKQHIPELFKKFSQLHNRTQASVGGSGLGLYMAKYIVEMHRGKIFVKSHHTEGTVFSIKLPLFTGKR